MSSATKDATAVHSGGGSHEENISFPSSSPHHCKMRLKPVLEIPDQDEGVLLGGTCIHLLSMMYVSYGNDRV